MIKLNNVAKRFGDKEILRDVSFSIGTGEVACLIGPSGSGKSTILRCINGLERHDAGSIEVDGQLVTSASLPQIRSTLGMKRSTILSRIILPLGIRTALPSLGNTTVMLLKDSSIASTITIAELTREGQLLAISTFRNGTIYLLIALLYLAASLPLAAGVRALERKMARK